MRTVTARTAIALAFLVTPACGDDTAGTASDSGGATSAGSQDASSSSAGSNSGSSSTTTDPASGSGTLGETTSTSDASATTNETSETGVDSGPKFDVGEMGDIGVDECQAKCGNTDWSYVWIANSAENTISKIDTRDVIEVGRYYTRPDTQGNPSRTSVSIDAKAVAVANRSGGITKIWARDEYCDDKNNNGVIDTSTGANDVRPFDQEECIAWHTPFPATTQRPIAWTSGVYNEETCEYDDQKIWTAAGLGSGGTWPCDGTDGIYVYLLDGETGAVEEEIHMPEVDCGGTFGPYGAAVDFKNDVWIYIWSAGKIVHVEFDTLNYEVINGGSYGITVDTLGRVWVGDYPRRYDPQQGIWEQPNNNLPGAGGAGIAEDLQGRMWTATQGGVGWVDRDSLVVGDTVPLPEGNGIYRGIGVDVDGYIWAVYLGGTTAHRIDPDTYEISTYTGLNSPYTYSDMAGGQINNVVCNPPNG